VNPKQLSKFYLYQQMVQAKLFIDNHSADKICLDAIACEASFSKFHFIRLFSTIYGLTPHQYLISVRIEKAKMLLHKGMAVQEVCNAVGFDSISSFNWFFKQAVSVTPSFYRKEQLERSIKILESPLKFVPPCMAKQYGWIK
jgi:AraC-like DNA-binding protein